MQILRNRSFIVIGLAFVAMNIIISKNYFLAHGYSSLILSGTDSEGYYQYLPYLFTKQDVFHQGYGIVLDNGMKLNKYTSGVALLQAPFFLMVYAGYKVLGISSQGFEPSYGLSIFIATSVYVYIALYALFLLLKKRFDAIISWISIIAIYFGSNLYYYTLAEPSMSHVYSFFCFSMFIYFTTRYYETDKIQPLLCVAFFLALATLIRPSNGLIFLFFLSYEVYSFADLKFRLNFHLKRWYWLLLFGVIALLVFSPQLYFWKVLTGKYLFYSYRHETFSNWSSPHLLQVLAGHKSGWLLYSPIMIFSLIGLFITLKNKMLNAPVITFIFAVTFYLCASWWAPTFGSAFGYRSFVEYGAFLIFPLTASFQYFYETKNDRIRFLIIALIILFIFYNIRITRLYYASGGCWDGPHWYWTNYLEKLKNVFYIR